jgi:hypothetical protein
MSDTARIIVDICKIIEEHKVNATAGYDKIGTEYWFGVLVESDGFRKDLQKVIDKYS